MYGIKILGFVILSLVATFIVIGFFYGEEVKQLIISEINKNLATEIKVAKIDFSLLRHFPDASVELHHVMAKDAIESKEKDTLLAADHLSLLFNLTGIFSNHI